MSYFFFFNDTATTEIYTLSLHDALPISRTGAVVPVARAPHGLRRVRGQCRRGARASGRARRVRHATARQRHRPRRAARAASRGRGHGIDRARRGERAHGDLFRRARRRYPRQSRRVRPRRLGLRRHHAPDVGLGEGGSGRRLVSRLRHHTRPRGRPARVPHRCHHGRARGRGAHQPGSQLPARALAGARASGRDRAARKRNRPVDRQPRRGARHARDRGAGRLAGAAPRGAVRLSLRGADPAGGAVGERAWLERHVIRRVVRGRLAEPALSGARGGPGGRRRLLRRGPHRRARGRAGPRGRRAVRRRRRRLEADHPGRLEPGHPARNRAAGARMHMTFRWFGRDDPIPLAHIRHIPGVSGVVSALYDVPVGAAWSRERLRGPQRKHRGVRLSSAVVESIPVHEDIKLGRPGRDRFIANYCESVRAMGALRIPVLCYNFMPVFDWLRTDLAQPLADGSTALAYDDRALAAVDLSRGTGDLPGWATAYGAEELERLLAAYRDVDAERLWDNLAYFLERVVPVAEHAGVRMAIHPDDPPWSIFGLPRLISRGADLERLVALVDSPANGVTFCTGSLGANPENRSEERRVGKECRSRWSPYH